MWRDEKIKHFDNEWSCTRRGLNAISLIGRTEFNITDTFFSFFVTSSMGKTKILFSFQIDLLTLTDTNCFAFKWLRTILLIIIRMKLNEKCHLNQSIVAWPRYSHPSAYRSDFNRRQTPWPILIFLFSFTTCDAQQKIRKEKCEKFPGERHGDIKLPHNTHHTTPHNNSNDDDITSIRSAGDKQHVSLRCSTVCAEILFHANRDTRRCVERKTINGKPLRCIRYQLSSIPWYVSNTELQCQWIYASCARVCVCKSISPSSAPSMRVV